MNSARNLIHIIIINFIFTIPKETLLLQSPRLHSQNPATTVVRLKINHHNFSSYHQILFNVTIILLFLDRTLKSINYFLLIVPTHSSIEEPMITRAHHQEHRAFDGNSFGSFLASLPFLSRFVFRLVQRRRRTGQGHVQVLHDGQEKRRRYLRGDRRRTCRHVWPTTFFVVARLGHVPRVGSANRLPSGSFDGFSARVIESSGFKWRLPFCQWKINAVTRVLGVRYWELASRCHFSSIRDCAGIWTRNVEFHFPYLIEGC